MKLKQEAEQTFEPELSTFASWMALKCADPEEQHLLCPQLLSDHSARWRNSAYTGSSH